MTGYRSSKLLKAKLPVGLIDCFLTVSISDLCLTGAQLHYDTIALPDSCDLLKTGRRKHFLPVRNTSAGSKLPAICVLPG